MPVSNGVKSKASRNIVMKSPAQLSTHKICLKEDERFSFRQTLYQNDGRR